jgi:hypothetical protein
MISDEIIRRRIPPNFAYKIPHSELIDQQDPTLDLDMHSGHGANVNLPGNKNSPDVDPIESPRVEDEKGPGKFKMVTPNVFPGSYTRLIATDQSAIAAEIRKYVSSNHVNPLGNASYIEYRRRLARFSSHSF